MASRIPVSVKDKPTSQPVTPACRRSAASERSPPDNIRPGGISTQKRPGHATRCSAQLHPTEASAVIEVDDPSVDVAAEVINTTGIVDIDVLISKFKSAMAEILEEKVSKMTREMRSVRQEVQEMHSAYTDLKHRMNGLEDIFEELRTMNSSHRTSLSARLADNVKRVVKLAELQEESKSYLSTVQSDVYGHNQRLDTLENRGPCSTHAASDTVADRRLHPTGAS